MIRRLKVGIQRNSGFSLNVMTDDEAHEIHLATLEVLRDTGVFVESEEAMAIYDGAGCIVDPKTKTVKFPAWVVEDAIRSAPSTFVACGRRPEDDVILQDNRVTFTNFGEGIRFERESVSWIPIPVNTATAPRRILKKQPWLLTVWIMLKLLNGPCAPMISHPWFKPSTTPP
jgi:hypothetical protein